MTELHRKSDFRFFHRLRVRWAEVDMQKIVFNAHYLMYVDTAVADYWRALAMLPMVKPPPWKYSSTGRRSCDGA